MRMPDFGLIGAVFHSTGRFSSNATRVGCSLFAVGVDCALIDATRNRALAASGNATRIGAGCDRHAADTIADDAAGLVDTDQTAHAFVTVHAALGCTGKNCALIASGQQSQTGLCALRRHCARNGQAGNGRTRLDIAKQAAVGAFAPTVIARNGVMSAVKCAAEYRHDDRTISRQINIAVEHHGQSLGIGIRRTTRGERLKFTCVCNM